MRLVLDCGLKTGGPVNAHPLTNTMTTAISTADLLRFFEATGHQPDWLEFPPVDGRRMPILRYLTY